MSTFEIDLHRMGKTPPPQIFSSGRGDWHSQATSWQRYRGSLSNSEQLASPWRQDPYSNDRSDGCAGFCAPSICSARPAQNTLSDDGSSPSSPKWSSQYGTVDSYGTVESYGTVGLYGAVGSYDNSNASYPLEHSYQIPFTGTPLTASPTAVSSTSSDYQSGSPAQATVYTTHPPDYYFPHDPNSQYPVKQEQQPARSPQGWGLYPNQNVDSFVLSPHLPYQPTHHDENQDIGADHPNTSPHVCDCGAKFERPIDLERHQRTSRRHNTDPHGPPCPIDPCNYPSNFTRVDNLKAHCMRQHGVSSHAVDAFIKEWRDRGKPKGPWWL